MPDCSSDHSGLPANFNGLINSIRELLNDLAEIAGIRSASIDNITGRFDSVSSFENGAEENIESLRSITNIDNVNSITLREVSEKLGEIDPESVGARSALFGSHAISIVGMLNTYDSIRGNDVPDLPSPSGGAPDSDGEESDSADDSDAHCPRRSRRSRRI